MQRVAFTMKLKPGTVAEYKRQHDAIWPDLVAEIRRNGIAEFTTFELDSTLFLYSEIADEQAWSRLWQSEAHKRWAQVMEPLMYMGDDGTVQSNTLREIFHIDTASS